MFFETYRDWRSGVKSKSRQEFGEAITAADVRIREDSLLG